MRRTVEWQMFRQLFKYRVNLVSKYILIIRHCGNERRAAAYRNLLFRMMGNIVLKNVTNYINLLNGAALDDIPSRDEVIADCWTMFDKCIEKFDIRHNANFYFYYNKSISRNFYTFYKKKLRERHAQLSDALSVVHPSLRVEPDVDETEVIYDNLGFTELERRISASRLRGQRKSEFLVENPDVTEAAYSRALIRMKKLLTPLKPTENG